MLLPKVGMSEKDARRFLEAELGRHESRTSFYWQNEETEEALDLMVEAIAKLVAANNHRIVDDMARNERMNRL